MAQGRLRNSQRFGRRGHMLKPGYGQKILQLCKLHADRQLPLYINIIHEFNENNKLDAHINQV